MSAFKIYNCVKIIGGPQAGKYGCIRPRPRGEEPTPEYPHWVNVGNTITFVECREDELEAPPFKVNDIVRITKGPYAGDVGMISGTSLRHQYLLYFVNWRHPEGKWDPLEFTAEELELADERALKDQRTKNALADMEEAAESARADLQEAFDEVQADRDAALKAIKDLLAHLPENWKDDEVVDGGLALGVDESAVDAAIEMIRPRKS